jgi:hypothetical protein
MRSTLQLPQVNGVDYLVTWNCRHIANPEIQRGIAAHLEDIGLYLPFMCTPEVMLKLFCSELGRLVKTMLYPFN